MQGWVVKEDSKQSHLYKPWTKRFLILEKETKTLKYAASEAVIGFPSQVDPPPAPPTHAALTLTSVTD